MTNDNSGKVKHVIIQWTWVFFQKTKIFPTFQKSSGVVRPNRINTAKVNMATALMQIWGFSRTGFETRALASGKTWQLLAKQYVVVLCRFKRPNFYFDGDKGRNITTTPRIVGKCPQISLGPPFSCGNLLMTKATTRRFSVHYLGLLYDQCHLVATFCQTAVGYTFSQVACGWQGVTDWSLDLCDWGQSRLPPVSSNLMNRHENGKSLLHFIFVIVKFQLSNCWSRSKHVVWSLSVKPLSLLHYCHHKSDPCC